MPIEVRDAVATAMRLLDEDGLDRLTVRRLATELGVKAPALYWHFASKRALLDHLADVLVTPVLAELPDPDTPWLTWLDGAATALRAALLAHRDGGRVAIGADPRVARALGEFVERCVGVLHRAGFSLADATRSAGVLLQFVLGRTVEEQARPGPAEEIDAVGATPWPLLARGIRERHEAGATPDGDFRYALGIILAGLDATRPR